jgi:hypothetical protein
MRPYQVVVVRSVQNKVSQIREWWRANRQHAPTLFDDELVEMLERLEVPSFGTSTRRDRAPSRDGFCCRRRSISSTVVSTLRAAWSEYVAIRHGAEEREPPL